MKKNINNGTFMNDTLELFSFYFGRPCKNVILEEYTNSQYLLLGHFTSSYFFEQIMKEGLQPPINTGYYSNDDMFKEEDENYIYLAGHFDRVFSENAIKKYGGEEILILVKVKKEVVELDDLNNMYSNKGISLLCNETIHKVLTQGIFSQCRTKENILPEQIIEVLSVDKLMNTKLSNYKSPMDKKFLTLSELKKNVDIKTLRYFYKI